MLGSYFEPGGCCYIQQYSREETRERGGITKLRKYNELKT